MITLSQIQFCENCCSIQVTVGLGCLSRLIALFAILMSIHRHTSPFFLGIMTRGETHGVDPSTFSMIPCFSRKLLCHSLPHVKRNSMCCLSYRRYTLINVKCDFCILQLANTLKQLWVVMHQHVTHSWTITNMLE